jgi:hypothetical protein
MLRVQEFIFDVTLEVEDETGKLQSMYIFLRQGRLKPDTQEVVAGVLYADHREDDNKLTGIELFGPVTPNILESVLTDQPDNIKNFVKSVVPSRFITEHLAVT